MRQHFYVYEQEILCRIAVLLGGRCAELIMYNDVSTGASDDIEKVSSLITNYTNSWGMNKEIGPLTQIARGYATDKVIEQADKAVDPAIKQVMSKGKSLLTGASAATGGAGAPRATKCSVRTGDHAHDLLLLAHPPAVHPVADTIRRPPVHPCFRPSPAVEFVVELRKGVDLGAKLAINTRLLSVLARDNVNPCRARGSPANRA